MSALLVACGGGGAADGGLVDGGRADAADEAPPLVVTTHGPVLGARGEGHQAFLGIPYAAPPVGELRWRPPRPASPWTEPRPSARGPACAQTGLGFGGSREEDCLYLNVHTPDPRPSDAPVMVWIHGGGFVFGEGLQIDGGTAGDRLAGHGVVVVSMNYRLGPFGFLAHPALTDAEGGGNYGLLDQRAALEWVRDNVAAFGGDPDNVTIFGESAGGVSVCAHLVSPGSAGLFHRAISQSGLCDTPYRTIEEAHEHGVRIADALGCSGDVAACLRSAGVAAIQEADPAASSLASLGARRVSWPVADGVVLPGDFRAQVRAGAVHRVPTMIGWNADEGTLFVMLAEQGGTVVDAAAYDAATEAFADLVGITVDAVRAQYPLADYPDPGAAIADALGHMSLACPSRRAARLLAEGGLDVFVYYFTYPDAGFQLAPSRSLGAFHSAEIQYVFGHPSRLGQTVFRGDDAALHEAISGYWAGFAASGDPNGQGALAWPSYELATDRHLVLDRTVEAGAGADAEACALWEP